MQQGDIFIYQSSDGLASIEVKLENDTVWLNLVQLSNLFDKDKSVISRHLKISLLKENWKKAQLLQKMQQFKWKGRGRLLGK